MDLAVTQVEDSRGDAWRVVGLVGWLEAKRLQPGEDFPPLMRVVHFSRVDDPAVSIGFELPMGDSEVDARSLLESDRDWRHSAW